MNNKKWLTLDEASKITGASLNDINTFVMRNQSNSSIIKKTEINNIKSIYINKSFLGLIEKNSTEPESLKNTPLNDINSINQKMIENFQSIYKRKYLKLIFFSTLIIIFVISGSLLYIHKSKTRQHEQSEKIIREIDSLHTELTEALENYRTLIEMLKNSQMTICEKDYLKIFKTEDKLDKINNDILKYIVKEKDK